MQHYNPYDRQPLMLGGLVTLWRVECSRGVSRTAAPGTRRIFYLAPLPVPS
jgi:hypothetical protein